MLDNVKALFKQERLKKTLEKLAIAQSMLQPTCFSIVVINDAIVSEMDVFSENPNTFEEYIFTSFFFKPMPESSLKVVILNLLLERFCMDNKRPEKWIDDMHLTTVFPDFFNLLHNELKQFTVSINEYMYLFQFLYPLYMQPAYKAANDIINENPDDPASRRDEKAT